MFKLKRWLKGDTLVEVTIAVGIFALVAISVVAVVNISTSGAQSALEGTLTREEVDSQAETLRFIQSAYVNDSNLDKDGADEESKLFLYNAIWDEVKNNADDNMLNGGAEVSGNFKRDFKPSSCSELYEEDYLAEQHAFIIDIRKLNTYDDPGSEKDVKKFAKQVVLSAAQNKDLFVAATTYPRLVYEKYDPIKDGNESEDALLSQGVFDILSKVEGIYIVGVKDKNTTSIVTEDSIENKSAYYDFYVRSCWYNAGSETPSTVSTLIRLRDPDSVGAVKPTGS